MAEAALCRRLALSHCLEATVWRRRDSLSGRSIAALTSGGAGRRSRGGDVAVVLIARGRDAWPGGSDGAGDFGLEVFDDGGACGGGST